MTKREEYEQKKFVGILNAYDRESVTIELEDGEMMQISRSDIALIRLAFDF